MGQYDLDVTERYHLVFSPVYHDLSRTNHIPNLSAVQTARMGTHRKHLVVMICQVVMPLSHVYLDDRLALRLVDIMKHYGELDATLDCHIKGEHPSCHQYQDTFVVLEDT